MALCYRYTDESLSEYSCLQLLRCPYCRDEEWMFPWKEEDKICFLTVMCQHHFIDDVLKTTFLFWCDHCICNGQAFSSAWSIWSLLLLRVLRETVSSYLGTIHHNHIWNKNIKYQKKKSWSQGNTISIFFIIPLILLTISVPKHHSASANLLSVKLLPFRPLDHPADRNAWNAGQKIFL